MKNKIGYEKPLFILSIIIAVTMAFQLYFAIRERSVEKIVGCSIVLVLSLISIILYIFVKRN